MDTGVFLCDAGHRLIDDIADFLSSIPDYPVTTGPSPRSLQATLPKTMPLTGMSPEAIVGRKLESAYKK